MNIFQTLSAKISNLLGLEVTAETAVELDEQLDSIVQTKENQIASTGVNADVVADVAQEEEDVVFGADDLEEETSQTNAPDIDDLSVELDLTAQRLEEATNELASANDIVSDLERQIMSLTSERDLLQTRAEDQANRIEELESELTQLNESYQDVSRRAAGLKGSTKVIRIPDGTSIATNQPTKSIGEVKVVKNENPTNISPSIKVVNLGR